MTGSKSKFRMHSASLTICAEVLHGGALLAPTEQGMNKLIKEGLSGIVTVDFSDKKTEKIITMSGMWPASKSYAKFL